MNTLLITGATGKVGTAVLERLAERSEFAKWKIRALCHHRLLDHSRVESVVGTIADQQVVQQAMHGVTHVLHMATCKETPSDVMDVTVKGMFWLLEAARQNPRFQQFMLIGGDAAIGHFFYPYDRPVTDDVPWRPYPGCYPLSKVLEEVLLQQYYTMYNLNGCCLRAPWIMAEDDFRYTLTFGPDVFGGPRWCDLVKPELAAKYHAQNAVPLMTDQHDQPIKRNFVHVEDLAEAILAALNNSRVRQQTLNICMDEPADYQFVANYLRDQYQLPSVRIATPYHSTWLDNTKAKLLLGWRPWYDTARLIDSSWHFLRPANRPRKVWYPG